MIDDRKERAERLLDLASMGRLSRRAVLKGAAAAGATGLIGAAALDRALAAGAVQSHNGRALAEAYDYVIVGAGAAGCALARRLVDGSDATVLLVEAGGDDVGVPEIDVPAAWVANIGSERDWTYFYAPGDGVDQRSILLSRGKVLGGSSSINALVWVRGDAKDYDDWAAQGAEGWDFRSILPQLKRMEDWEDGETALRGAGGPIRVERAKDLHPVAQALIDAGQALGMPFISDMNGPTNEGVGPINMNVRDGARCSAARGYLRPVLDRPQLTVLTGAKARKLVMEGTRCIGVDLLVGDAQRRVRAGREVVLCAGAIDSPRLLMLSGIGPADELKGLGIDPVVDLAGVGRNLQEHILLGGMIYEATGELAPFNNNLEGSTFFSRSHAGLDRPDLMFVTMQIPYLMPHLAGTYPLPPNAFTLSPGLVGVKSRGHVRMLSDRHDGPMEIQPNLLRAPEDQAAMLAGFDLGLEIADQAGFRALAKARVAPKPGRLSREEKMSFIRQTASTYFHPCGTCRMGVDAMAVTDPATLKVRGVEGLRVADASVFPSITSANTHVPSILIGEVASDMILAG